MTPSKLRRMQRHFAKIGRVFTPEPPTLKWTTCPRCDGFKQEAHYCGNSHLLRHCSLCDGRGEVRRSA